MNTQKAGIKAKHKIKKQYFSGAIEVSERSYGHTEPVGNIFQNAMLQLAVVIQPTIFFEFSGCLNRWCARNGWSSRIETVTKLDHFHHKVLYAKDSNKYCFFQLGYSRGIYFIIALNFKIFFKNVNLVIDLIIAEEKFVHKHAKIVNNHTLICLSISCSYIARLSLRKSILIRSAFRIKK